MIGSACTWINRIILSILQLTMIPMISLSTPEQRSAMAPAAQRDCAETSLCVKPRWVPARSFTVALRWDVIIMGIMFVQWTIGVLKRARWLSVGVPWCRRWSTRSRNVSFGHNRGSPVDLWPIFSPRAPFFCVVKTSITNTSAASSLSVVVTVLNTVRPKMNVTYDRRKGELSYFVPVYSPGHRRKKKAIIVVSVKACSSGSLEAASTQANRSRTCTGIGLTQEVGGS